MEEREVAVRLLREMRTMLKSPPGQNQPLTDVKGSKWSPSDNGWQMIYSLWQSATRYSNGDIMIPPLKEMKGVQDAFGIADSELE